MATSQQKIVEHTSDNADNSITIKMKKCKIDDTKQAISSESQPGTSTEKSLEVVVGLNPSNPSEVILELSGIDPLEIVLEDSSEWESDDDDSDLEIDIIIQLKITLLHIHPPIWRCIQVSSNDTFEELHYYIQEAMGWKSCHAHSFTAKDLTMVSEFAYDFYKEMGSTDVVNEEHVALSEVFSTIGDKVFYEYDHGDSWEHEIVFEKFVLVSGNSNIVFPRCVGGERACPPEDCGGVDGYVHLLEVKNNPEHEEYEDLIANWLEEFYPGFDPETFDETAVFQDLDVSS